jgi:predicted RNA-binding protein with PIN domain
MSLHFLLDAYNIIYQMPTLAQGSLEEQRQKLIDLIDAKRPQGSPKNLITIVFDGRAAFYNQHTSRTARVVFAQTESADERILRLVDEAKHRKSMVVVTNDRPVQYAARALGASVMSVAEFMEKAGPPVSGRKAARGKRGDGEPKEISQALEQEINEELKSRWLKRKTGPGKSG